MYGGIMKRTILLGVLLLLVVPALSRAQEYPTKPINILITFAPGGNVGNTIRFLASKAEKSLGQPFLLSNNGAGGGSVALTITAKERPDGYHLSGCTSTGLIRLPQFRSVPYKFEDFVPIMHYGGSCSGIVVRSNSPWTTLKEFVEYAKKNPGKINYSTLGVGSPHHLAMEYIAKKEGIQWTHIPYPGSGPALTAVLGGHVTAESGDSTWMPHVQQGTLRLLATHTETRMRTFPNIPTMREMGYDFINETVYMLAAPRGTPPAIINKLDNAFHKAMDDPDFLQLMDKMEIQVTYRNSEETRKYLEDAYVRLGRMIQELKLPKEPEK